MEAIVFWGFALLAILGGFMLIFHKNPIHSALSLILTLFCTAAIYVLLHAGFIAVLQVLIYAGAIMVLFVFVIMLLNLQREEMGLRQHRFIKVVAVLLASVICFVLVSVIGNEAMMKTPLPETFGSIESLGMQLFTTFLLPFEAIAMLLLAAVVGAVVVAKSRF